MTSPYDAVFSAVDLFVRTWQDPCLGDPCDVLGETDRKRLSDAWQILSAEAGAAERQLHDEWDGTAPGESRPMIAALRPKTAAPAIRSCRRR